MKDYLCAPINFSLILFFNHKATAFKLCITAITSVVISTFSFSQDNSELIEQYESYKSAVITYQSSSLDTSRIYLDSCFYIAYKIENRFYLGDALNLKSRDFFLRSYSDSALFYGERAIEIFQAFPDSIAHFVAEYNLGNIYLAKGDYIKGLVQFKKVLRIIDTNFDAFLSENDSKINMNRAYCYFSIGIVYDFLGDYETKLKNLQKSLKISLKVHTRESEILQSVVLGNIGLTYFQLGNYEWAESYAIRGLELKKKLGTENTNGYNYQVLAKAAHGRKKYPLALKYLQLADKSFHLIQNVKALHSNEIWRAKCYFAQKKHDLALELLLPLEDEYNPENSARELLELYDLLSEVYAYLNDYKMAHSYLYKAKKVREDLVSKNSIEAVDGFLSFFEEEEERIDHKINNFKTLQEKEKLQMEVAAQKEKQVWVYSLFIVSIICLILIIIVIARGNQRNKKVNQELSDSIDEKQILFKEVHHRVKNNFQIISSLLNLQQGIEENERGKKVLVDAQGRIQSMSLVHEMLYRKNEVKRIDFKSYTEELVASIIRSYGNDPVKVEYTIECGNESFDLELAVPLGLMLNEAITNSVKYAFAGKTTGSIQIILKPADKRNFLLIIKDNGVGIPSEFINGGKETLGIELICILSEQLGGSVQFLNAQGTEVRIVFNAID